jgi:hypothetical protein
VTARELPLRHLSVRVPWHDTATTDGSARIHSLMGLACGWLRISPERNDEREMENAGRAWVDLDNRDLPPCSAERAGFMSPNARSAVKNHPYSAWNDTYKKFQPTPYEIPAFAADCVPFRWMCARTRPKSPSDTRSPTRLTSSKPSTRKRGCATQRGSNTRTTSKPCSTRSFGDRARQEPHLRLQTRNHRYPPTLAASSSESDESDAWRPSFRTCNGATDMAPCLWERVIRHAKRPSMNDGFVLPYQEVLRLAARDSAINPEDFAVFVPDEFTDEFSFASEHVSHDAALNLLLSLERVVERFAEQLRSRSCTFGETAKAPDERFATHKAGGIKLRWPRWWRDVA